MKGDKLVLITDCTRAGGWKTANTRWAASRFCKGRGMRLADGTIAGSVLKLNHAVRNYLRATGCPVWEAVNAASLTPAKVIHVDDRKGASSRARMRISPSWTAISKSSTIIGGKTVYTA